MFELPDAKRVRREDLGSDSEDEAPSRDEKQDAELLAKLHARMAGMLDLGSAEQPAPTTTPPKKTKHVPPATEKRTTASSDDSSDEEELAEDKDAEMTEAAAAEPEEFEFRLFSTAPATKIALVDEDELAFEGEGAMIRKRPLSYYLAVDATPEERAAFEEAAVSGEDVLERAKQRWWGMETPWRVIRVESEEETKKGGVATKKDGESGEAAARRRRPGKRKRIALRMKERERKKKAEEEEKAKMGKEEALKEKKKRINRLKKLRKRKKDKEAKQGGGAGGGDGDGAEAEDSGEGSEGDDE